MKARKIVGIIMILMGTGAMFGNYLWLIGAVPKPTDDLMTARWFYGIAAYVVGSFVGFVEPL